MTTALFGSTGFVGSNIRSRQHFDEHFHSRNAAESLGKSYELVVFSAAKAEKWRANQNAEADLQHIMELESTIAGFNAERFVLISTVDVYGSPINVDESSPIEIAGLHPYGAHRYRLEQFVRNLHPDALIVRLPGLFGPGLKKNVIFDLLNDNDVQRVNPNGAFQYYNVANAWRDIQLALENELTLVNLTSPPITTRELARVAFGQDFENELSAVAAGRYDVQSRYSGAFGGSGEYTFTEEEILRELKAFVTDERASA